MGKAKSKVNPRKQQQAQITRVEVAIGDIFQEVDRMNKNIIGLESLVMHFADFLEKRPEFEKYLEELIKKANEDREKKAK